ncbi:MAG: CBS domain-containing protein [Dehalococcoidia bacterium]
MKVRDIMVQPLVTVREETTLHDVAQTMLERRVGCVLVLDGAGELRGIITESDFIGKERGIPFSSFRMPQVFGQWFGHDDVERVHEAARERVANEIMSKPVVTIEYDETVTELVRRMIARDIKRVPVVREGKLVGIVARHDLLKLMAEGRR